MVVICDGLQVQAVTDDLTSMTGFRNSVPVQQGTTLYGTSYGATNSQSTTSSYYSGACVYMVGAWFLSVRPSKSTTGRVPAQQSSDYKSNTADQYYYNSISSSKSQQLGGAGAKSSKGSIKRYPPLNG
uniref:Uncharacterized protein n=1 Tax=Oryza sativa subsp. japonica TaxID=39947 RepID=Q6ZDT5_ORYSJ|nr:hypothetical protein [Oryza sativa Japonica Group]